VRADLRPISSDAAAAPEPATLATDVFGNAVVMASFQIMANNLVIDSATKLQLDVAAIFYCSDILTMSGSARGERPGPPMTVRRDGRRHVSSPSHIWKPYSRRAVYSMAPKLDACVVG